MSEKDCTSSNQNKSNNVDNSITFTSAKKMKLQKTYRINVNDNHNND